MGNQGLVMPLSQYILIILINPINMTGFYAMTMANCLQFVNKQRQLLFILLRAQIAFQIGPASFPYRPLSLQHRINIAGIAPMLKQFGMLSGYSN